MTDKLEEEINVYDKIIVKNYNTLSLAEQFEKGVVVKVDDELAILKQQPLQQHLFQIALLMINYYNF